MELQSPLNSVIPAQAGIQTEDVNPVSLDSRLRGNDGGYPIFLAYLTLCSSTAVRVLTHLIDFVII